MRIHNILASEDASKKKAHGNTSEQKIEWKRGEEKAKVKWGRGKQEANDK